MVLNIEKLGLSGTVDMKRRAFISLPGGAAAWPLAARAQQAARLPTIGYLGSTTRHGGSRQVAAFVQQLRNLGWIEGRNHRVPVSGGAYRASCRACGRACPAEGRRHRDMGNARCRRGAAPFARFRTIQVSAKDLPGSSVAVWRIGHAGRSALA
jgi:hypothetical protein